MPFHEENGSPFFQLARTVIQQASFALELHIEPDRILSHYDRVTHLSEIFVRLSTTYYNQDPRFQQWTDTIHLTQIQIIQGLEELREYTYYEDLTNDSVILHSIIPQFDSIPTGG